MPEPENPQRDTLIDALRGCAVIGMIVAHALFFFHDGSNQILNTIETFLNLTVITFFVFVSGLTTSLWLDIHQITPTSVKQKRLLKRLIMLYGGYVILAVIAILTQSKQLSNFSLITSFLGAITFFSPPNFTEYLILFILLTVTVLIFMKYFLSFHKSLTIILLLSIVLYTFGIFLYPLTFPAGLEQLKELLAGSLGSLRFPLLFYLPVYLIAIWWHAEKKIAKKIMVFVSVTIFTLLIVMLEKIVRLPMLEVTTRWPPSIGYLALGMFISITFLLILPLFNRFLATKIIHRFLENLGIYAFDLWIIHLLLLFLYQRFVGNKFSDPFTISLAIFLLICLSLAFSTLLFFQTRSIFLIYPQGSQPFKNKPVGKMYILLLVIIVLISATVLHETSTSNPYGNSMPISPLNQEQQPQLPTAGQLTVSTDRSWYIHETSYNSVHLTVALANNEHEIVSFPLKKISLYIDGEKFPFSDEKIVNTSHLITLSSEILRPGTHSIFAEIIGANRSIFSEHHSVTVSEPVMVAWTFDWEGWDATDKTLGSITSFAADNKMPFTHFVSPRTFLDGVLSPERRQTIISFLLARQTQGDEIAMHLHMQFDYVKAAGVVPRTAHPWGLLTQEGYDVPTTDYSPEEFRKLVSFGKTVFNNVGFSSPDGYRAGGWFLSAPQIKVLEEEGFTYDSSAREKAASGAFSALPWNIPDNALPYFPDSENENIISQTPRRILEIPNNAGNTYEFSIQELNAHLANLSPNSPQMTPRTLVYISHPQFSSREFVKIPSVLKELNLHTANNDTGPIVFVTMSEMQTLWESYLH